MSSQAEKKLTKLNNSEIKQKKNLMESDPQDLSKSNCTDNKITVRRSHKTQDR